MKIKRLFDVVLSVTGILITGWLVLFLWLLIMILSKQRGFFTQERIGQYGKPFVIYKLRTIFDEQVGFASKTGRFLRKSKIDEFPQLWNILIGEMSFVGPRPDVSGYYDKLQGEERKILELKPGLTSAASLKYFNEEYLLSQQEDPLSYNDTVIFPDKIQMNLNYYYHRSFWGDLVLVWRTLIGRKESQTMR